MLDDGRGDRRRRRRVDAARARTASPPTRSCAASCRCSTTLAGAPVSIDTSKAEVARRALELGAELVNDVTALRGDPELAGVVADAGCYLCLMHMQRRAAHDAGRPALRRRRLRGEGASSRSGSRSPSRQGIREERDLPRPRHRLRQDGRAQLRARAPARRAGRARTAGAGRLLAQELARPASGDPAPTTGSAARVGRRRGRRLRARRDDPPRARRPRARRGARASRGGGRRDEGRAARPRAASATTASTRRSSGDGQQFLYDVELEVGERGADDRLEDAVDYREVAARRPRGRTSAGSTCSRRSPTAVADALSSAFRAERVSVRVRKPEVRPAGSTVEFSAVTVDAAVTRAYVGLGANLGDREATDPRARAELIGASAALDDPRDRAVGRRATSRGS